MKPFFTFFGGKWRDAPNYPRPVFETIVEPFAGSAGYSVRNWTKKVVLVEKDEIIASLWKFLITTTPEEILKIPVGVTHVDQINGPPEWKYLAGFWMNKASTGPRKSPSSFMRSGIRPNSHWGEVIRHRVASQVDRIKHWKIICGDYKTSSAIENATWFVDPPYQSAGHNYRCKFTDYVQLSEFCRTRSGQVIVCESNGADWLPFRHHRVVKSMEGMRGRKNSHEVIWTNNQDGIGS